MNSRMSKYHYDDEVMDKRVDKNRNTYKDMGEIDLDNLDLANNVSVIETSGEKLNISELQDILKKKYVSEPSNHTPSVEAEIEQVDLEITKEYNLKDAMDKAYSEKDDDYEKNRYKKLRDTEYEILKSIKVSNTEAAPSFNHEEGEEITSLLKTIDENALRRSKKNDELLGDLLSDSDTNILEPIKPDTTDFDITPPKPTLVEELEKTKQLSKKDIMGELEKEAEKVPEIETSTTNTNTFYTGNLAIEDADLEDFKELEEEMKSNSILVKVLIILLVLVVLVVAVYLLNKYLNLGLF